jgi:hypothetical protein
MSEHTKEPWIVIDFDPHHGTYIEDEHGETICDLYVIDRITDKPIQQNNAEANARRIVACVNTCEGIDTERLELTKSNNETLLLLDLIIVENNVTNCWRL